MNRLSPSEKAADSLRHSASPIIAMTCQLKQQDAIASMHHKSIITGKKVGGYTTDQLSDMLAFELSTTHALERLIRAAMIPKLTERIAAAGLDPLGSEQVECIKHGNPEDLQAMLADMQDRCGIKTEDLY